MSTQITIPGIASVVFQPNPVIQNSNLTVVVEVTETIITIDPYKLFSGDLFSGEV